MSHRESAQASRECVQCLYRSSHPFGLRFDPDGLCTGCVTHREKFELDWEARFAELERLVRQPKRSDQSRHYDCVVPIRGTPEYFYVMDVVKNRLGLNPLAVSYNSQFNSEAGIRNLDLIRETFDVDIVIYASNAAIYKKLIRKSLHRFSNMRWPYLAGESVFPVQIATERRIPLIVWPYHQPTEQVGMHSYTEAAEMSRHSRSQFDLLGVEPEELTTPETLVRGEEIYDLQYPADQILTQTGLRGIYLSNFLPWDSRRYSEDMVRRFSALGASNPRTFDTYDRIDDMTYMTVHDVLKFYRHGYSRVSDNLCREIRFGRITRDDARTLEQYYQADYPEEEILVFLDWLGMDYSAFEWLAERLPFYENQTRKAALNADQLKFISGFIADGPPVTSSRQFIVYGKGLDL